MPKIKLPIPEILDSVTRPITLEVVRKIMKTTGLSSETPINYPGANETVQQTNSSIDASGPNIAAFNNNDLLKIEVEELFSTDMLLNMAVVQPEHPLLFLDDELGIVIRPVYGNQEISINFRYRCANITRAEQWRNNVRNKLAQGYSEEIFNISYHYLIPFELLHILEHLHLLREKQAGYGQDYATYLTTNASGRLTKEANLSGAASAYAIAETQGRIQGWFDFEGVPEKASREGEGEVVTISFAFKFRYEKPTGCEMSYPLLVHNQLIDKKYRPSGADALPFNPETLKRYQSLSGKSLSYFEQARNFLPYTIAEGFSYPAWDEFLPSTVYPKTKRIFTLFNQVNPNDLRECVKIGDFKDFKFDLDVLRLVMLELPYMAKYGKSIFNLVMYESGHQIAADKLTVDTLGNVRTLFDMNLRLQYHIRFSVITDLDLLDQATIDRIRNEGKGLIKIIDYADPTLKDKGLLPGLVGDKLVPKKDLDKVKDEWNKLPVGNGQQYSFNTVEILFVETDLIKE